MPRTVTFLICSVGLLAAIGYLDLRDEAKSMLRQVIPEAKRTATDLLDVVKEEVAEPQTGEESRISHATTPGTLYGTTNTSVVNSQSHDRTNTTVSFRGRRSLPAQPSN